MHSLQFKLELLADTVLSADSATSGSHECLDYIPGNMILGLCASRLYGRTGVDSYDAFHSGKVRFSNAYPVAADGSPAFPIPFAWHHKKGDDFNESGKIITDKLFSLNRLEDGVATEWRQSSIQVKQIRQGYFSATGLYCKPEKRFHLKTAVDRNTRGGAREGHLFGYEYLVAGSKWYFQIHIDGQPNGLDKRIIDALCAPGLRIGRSRSAEYGAVRISRVEGAEAMPSWVDAVDPQQTDSRTFFCLSDLCLRDPATGCLTAVPRAQHFGLKSGTFDKGRSFIRTTKVSVFNGKRRRYDLERIQICKGSVITFTNVGPDEGHPDSLAELSMKGVGEYRQEGLGKIAVDPWFLKAFQPRFEDRDKTTFHFSTSDAGQPSKSSELNKESRILTEWLENKVRAKTQLDTIAELVEQWSSLLISAARSKPGKSPSTSQWNLLGQTAYQHECQGEGASAVNDLHDRLFHIHRNDQGEIDKRLSRGLLSHGVSAKVWKNGARVQVGDTRHSFADFIEQVVFPAAGEDPRFIRQALYLLGKRMSQLINQDK